MPGDASTNARKDEARMPFGDHLEELRVCLIRALAGAGVATIVSLIFAKHILRFILTPAIVVLHAHGERAELLALSPQGPFILYLKVGFLSGLVIATPWITHQIWKFVSSGLFAREQRFVTRFAPISAALFVAGVSFMFFIVLPIVLNFFVTFSQGFELPEIEPSRFQKFFLPDTTGPPAPADVPLDLQIPIVDEDPVDPPVGTVWFNNQHDTLRIQAPAGIMTSPPFTLASKVRAVSSQYGIQDYVSMVFALALGFGLAFELPVLVVFLAATGLVSTTDMGRARRYVFFGIVIAAAILTPPDVISQILLAVPMFVLFESGLRVGRVFERPREPS